MGQDFLLGVADFLMIADATTQHMPTQRHSTALFDGQMSLSCETLK